MEKSPIDVLLRARYDKEYSSLRDFIVVILHRGAKNDEKRIDGARIISVQKDGFWYLNKFNEEIFIPAHRIKRLILKS